MNNVAFGPQTLASASQLTGATALAGAAKQVRPAPNNGVKTNDQVFKFGCSAQFNGGASTPTGQCKVQGSYDSTTWFDIATGTAFTSNDTVNEEQLADTSGQVLPPYVRGITVLAGGTAPTKQVVTIFVTSNGDFTVT